MGGFRLSLFLWEWKMLEFKSKKLEFKFNDVKHSISFPSVMQLRSFSENYEKEEDKIGMIYNLVTELGMDKDICNQLEIGMLEQILTELTVSKK